MFAFYFYSATCLLNGYNHAKSGKLNQKHMRTHFLWELKNINNNSE